MKKSILAIAMLALGIGNIAHAYESDAQVNYGDPTASYRGLGVQGSKDADQAVGVFGFGEHIASFDLGKDHKANTWDYRARYFNVDSDTGFGWSVDVLGSEGNDISSGGVMAGLVQKFQLTDNIIVVPMLAAGKASAEHKEEDFKTSSWVAQPGVYALYAFDAGHWVYANPKSTYVHEDRKWSSEVEIGGGYMISDNASIGIKYETSRYNGISDNKTSLNAYFYF